MRIILRDGRVADLRQPTGSQADYRLLADLFSRASPDSLYFRFFHVVSEVSPEEMERMMRVVPHESFALVTDAGDRFLGIGNYVRQDDESAEVAFFVDDQMQGRGLGTLLLEHLAERAWREGFKRFIAYVLADNRQMLRVFRSSGFQVSQRWTDGAIQLTLPLRQTERQQRLAALREKLATAASLQPFFHPNAVAVVGASRDDNRLGHQLLKHILDSNYQGTVYPVNRAARSVHAIHAYPRISDIPQEVDLAIVVVPVNELLGVVNDAIYAGVHGMVVTTSGLGESEEPQGRSLQELLTTKLRQAGIRLVGPNSMGLVSTASNAPLNASFAPELPKPGHLAVASHSGALGVAIMRYASETGIGISSFVSLGNKPDVSVNDLLQYWEDDPETAAIMLYMESFGNPRKFSQIARRLTRTKPILAVKSARSQRAAALPESPRRFGWDPTDAPVDALFRQSGIIRADTLEELFDVAAILTTQPPIKGRRVGLVTNTAAGHILAEDVVRTVGLTLAHVVDVGFSELAQGYRAAIPAMLDRDDVDAVALMYVPVDSQETETVVRVIEEEVGRYYAQADHPLPIVSNILFASPSRLRFIEAGDYRIPVFPFPETAMRALARVAEYGQFLLKPPGQLVDLPGLDSALARHLMRQALQDQAERRVGWTELNPVFEAMGIQLGQDAGMGEAADDLQLALLIDPLFGPIVGVKSSDGDIRIRLVPLTDHDAAGLVPSVVRREGAEDWWIDLLLRISRLAEECPELERLELSDVRIRQQRGTAVGCYGVLQS